MKNRFLPKFTIGAIPSSYLDSLTYLEQILCINEKLCEIIKYLDDISIDEITNLIDEKISSITSDIKEYVDKQDELLYNELNNNIVTQINLVKLLVNEKIEFLTNYIDSSNEILKLQFEAEINELKSQIDEIIIKGIDVYNPTTGKYDNIQNVVYDLYKYLRYYGIKALDFDALGLTCSSFENKQLTARNFDLYSNNILTIDFKHNMFSPFTGKIESIRNIINQLADFHKTPISASQFDNLEYTANDFDSLEITAYNFDWHGGTILSA